MILLPPLNGETRMYADTLQPAHGRTCIFYAPDLEKSARWYATFLNSKLFCYSYVNKENSRFGGTTSIRNDQVLPSWAKPDCVYFPPTDSPLKWQVILGTNEWSASMDNWEWRVRALIDLHDLIKRMKVIGVEPVENPTIQEMINDYPRGWRKYANEPKMAHYLGRRPHHSTACAFVDPAGTIIIVRLQVQEPDPRHENTFLWR